MPWAPDLYVPAADLQDFVRVNADNPYVETYGTAAARSIDDFCGRQFGQLAAPASWSYPMFRVGQMPDGRWFVPTDDIHTLTGLVVTVDAAAVDAGVDGYQLWEPNAIAKGYPHIGITLADRPTEDITVAASFGWNAVPAAVKAACWLQVNRWNIRRESPYGTAGSPSEGTEIRLSSRLDPDVRAMLSSVVRGRMPA